MNKIKKIVSLSLSLLVAGALFVSPRLTFAKVGDNLYGNGFKSRGEVVEFLNENQVPKEKQDILIKKLENNQMWDVNNPEKIKEVPESFYVFNPQEAVNGNEVRYYRFNDGSFIKIETAQNDAIKIDGSEKSKKLLREKIKDEKTLKKLEDQVINYGVESGSGYSWYYDYRVSYTKATLSASMVTEFVLVNGGNDYVIPSGFYEPRATGFGELGQMPAIQIVREKEDSSMSRWALAESYWYCNYPISTPWGGSSLSGTKYLCLGVGNNTFKVADTTPY